MDSQYWPRDDYKPADNKELEREENSEVGSHGLQAVRQQGIGERETRGQVA